MRVLVMAPFERGRSQGGSQRSTAIAERLEERGIAVEWQTVARRDSRRMAKLGSMARGEPSLTGLYQQPARRPRGDLDAVMVAHSYLVPAVAEAAAMVPRIVDFHNLEFRHLVDGRRRGAGVLRRAYDRGQVRLMRRLELELVRTSDLSLLVSDDEHGWARAAAPSARTLVVRSVLPRSEERAAAAIRARREPRRGELAYVGRLTFPTNLRSLEQFLSRDWPAMRAGAPGLRLTVAGACDEADRARLGRHPGVTVLGFVEDLTAVLAGCQAVLMPFEGVAGTSLRALFYAVAGLPVIGSPQAFRGIPFQIGTVAGSCEEWAAAARRLATVTSLDAGAQDAARRRAQALQSDPRPWDRLAEAIAAMSDRSAPRTDPLTAGAQA